MNESCSPLSPPGIALSRRNVLVGGFSLLAGGLTTPSWAQEVSNSDDFWIQPRTIRMSHASGEKIVSTYWSDGEYINDAYREISWFMRDRVVNEAVYMNPVLLDITYGVCGWLAYFGIREYVNLNSGHRNRKRNGTIEGAAKESLHITGDAIDVKIPGVNALQTAKFGAWLGGGGVGWYPSKQFTHLDRGRLRVWKG